MHCDIRHRNAPTLYDSEGNILTGYYQWDINQYITIKGLPVGSTLKCHFAKIQGFAAYEVAPVVSGEDYVVYIPNEMFRAPNNFYLYLYVDTPEDGQRTKYEYEICVRYRAKPSDWEEPTPEEKATMRSMLLKAEGYAVGTHDGIPVTESDIAYHNNAKYYAEQAGKAANKPYLSLERVSRYLYNVSFEEAPPDTGVDSLPGLCSSYVQDGKLYRNLDWNYDRNATFHVFLPGIEGTAFIDGLTDSNLDDELISQLPYHLVDGVNENGIMVSTHVLYNDWEAVGTGDIPLTYLPYVALTRVRSMNTLEADLDGVLDNLKSTPALIASGYLIQVLVSDGTTTYVLRPGNAADATYEAVNITANPKLSNFLWVPDATVVRSELQTRPTGVERWNMMPCPLEELRFTKCYEAPTRLSEFIGLRGTTKDSTDAELLDIYTTAHDMYLERTRDGSLWQTMHSVVYGPTGMEHLCIQEDWTKDYISNGNYEPPIGGIPKSDLSLDVQESLNKADTASQSYIHSQMIAEDIWVISHNMNRYPSVMVTDSSGNSVVGDVQYIDANTVKVVFTSAFSGKAYLN